MQWVAVTFENPFFFPFGVISQELRTISWLQSEKKQGSMNVF